MFVFTFTFMFTFTSMSNVDAHVRRRPDRCRPSGKKRFFINFVCFLVLSKLVCAGALHLACILGNTFRGIKNIL